MICRSDFHCDKCDISYHTKHQVYGIGKSFIMFIGENPGYKEDKLGIPFVGKSGNLLRTIMKTVGINPDNTYITNVVKCKTPINRVPSDIEIANCKPYLREEIKENNPEIIVLLGNTAFNTFFETHNLLYKEYRGEWIKVGKCKIFTTYHPSHILRNTENIGEYMKHFKEIAKEVRKLNPFIGD